MLNNIERYNAFFAKSKDHAYGKPGKFVELILSYAKPGAAVDLGSGDGRNALFLAEHGFQVKAIDTSTAGLEELSQVAKAKKISVETAVGDVARWQFDKSYDVILAITILQHLQTADALRVLADMKAHTKPGGLNVISLFTSTGGRYELDRVEDPGAFYPADGWLKDFYADWEVLEYEEALAPLMNRFKPDGTPMTNIMAKILARKP